MQTQAQEQASETEQPTSQHQELHTGLKYKDQHDNERVWLIRNNWED